MKKSAIVSSRRSLASFVFLVLSAWGGESLAFVAMDFTGSVPESASVTVNVSKPAGAVNGTVTLSIYDADFPDEGALVINGNPPITLFGASGVKSNDQKFSNVTFSTPASYWSDGNNSLLFRHTRTAGFVVDNVTVSFDAANTSLPANSAVPGGSFPVEMLGKPPEQASVTVDVSKPAGAVNGVITLTSYDADFANEGELIINGNAPVVLFGSSGVKGNDQNSADININTPASYWKNGTNTLLFKHTKTAGFVIDAVSVSFEAQTTVAAAAVTQAGSFPVEMLGRAPEQASVTVNVNKPAGAASGEITLASYDADFANEGELVINGNAPLALFGSSGVKGNDQNSADIKFSTPASYWKNGANTLLFKHTNTAGFAIDAVSVSFKNGATLRSVSQPIVINGERDVVISGVRVSNPGGSCIDIKNGATNVTIQNSEIGPCGDKGIDIQNSSNIKITGNHIYDAATEGIRSYRSHNIVVDSNVIENVESGYEIETTNIGNISFTNNYVKNVHRGPINGGNVVMLSYVHASGIRIVNNIGINVLGESDPEDLVNVYQSDGTAAAPILISGNKFYGGGPSASSGGIILGDGGGSYQLAENNILVNPGGYGLSIAGGDHNRFRNNKVYSDDQRAFSNVGVSIWRFNNNGKGTPPGQCHSHTVANNEITWWKGPNYKGSGQPATRAPYYNPNFGADKLSPNCGSVAGWNTNKFDTNSSQPANLNMSIWNPAWNTP